MCGIVGYIGAKEKKRLLIDGLRELEYRGYDSAGIAVLADTKSPKGAKNSQKNKSQDLQIYKEVGKLENLERKCENFESSGFGVGIGHTRWATHGKPTQANAHPHFGAKSSVVHNGIIENFQSLKDALVRDGVSFLSQTDTEVIVHLFEKNLNDMLKNAAKNAKTSKIDSIKKNTKALKQPLIGDSSLEFAAFCKTIEQIQGSYAILLITQSAPNKIFFAKNGSPLIIGEGLNSTNSKKDSIKNSIKENSNEIFFASSDAPLVGLAQSVVYLEDGDFGVISFGDFCKLNGAKPLFASRQSAQKDGFAYFMEKEIYEQNAVLAQTMMGRVSEDGFILGELDELLDSMQKDSIRGDSIGGDSIKKRAKTIESNIESKSAKCSDIFTNARLITLCACGTSYHSALSGAYLLERLAGVKTKVEIASEFRYKEPVIERDEIFIAISQSGETADTLEACKLAKAAGAIVLAICNVDNSSIVRISHASLLTRAGIEKGVASTKAFATQVMVLWIFAAWLGVRRGRILRGDSISSSGDSIKPKSIKSKNAKNAKNAKGAKAAKIGTKGIESKTKSSIKSIESIESIESGAKNPLDCATIANQMFAATRATKLSKSLHDRIKRLSRRYLNAHGFFFIGRDIFYPLALEGALKLKEISYLHAEGYPSGEMKHGPIALADSGLACVALLPAFCLYEKVRSNVEELSARDALICGISDEKSASELCDDFIEISPCESEMEEFFSIMLVLQVFALEVALRLGNDVDMPRNLAKSVTVE